MTTAAVPKSQQPGRGRAAKWLAPLPLVLLLLFFFFAPVGTCLAVTDYHTGRIRMALPVKDGETFSIRFTHSLNLSDVTDEIVVDGASLVCASSLFTAYGAGIPDPAADGIGRELTLTDAGFLLTGIDKAQARIPILLQEVPNHRLLYRGAEINLLGRFGSGALVVLSVRPATLFLLLAY